VAADREYLDVYAYLALDAGAKTLRDPMDGVARSGHEIALKTFEGLGRFEEARHTTLLRDLGRSQKDDLGENRWREIAQLATDSLERNEIRNYAIAMRLLALRETQWDVRRSILRKILTVQRSAGHWAEAHTLRTLAMSARELGGAEDEIAAWQEAIQRGEEIGYVGTLAEAHLELARAFLRGGQVPSMWVSMAHALTQIRAQNRPAYLYLAISHLTDLLRIAGDVEGYASLVAFLRQALSRGRFTLHPKFSDLQMAIESNGEAPEPLAFATTDDVVEWAEIQAAFALSDRPQRV
jgi:hypothetical protein